MRTVTLQMNLRVNNDMNFSVKTEVVADETDPYAEGTEAARWLMTFTRGLGDGWEALNDDVDLDE